MGTSFSIVHDFECDAATYWEIFWDEEFNQQMYAEMQCGRTLLGQKEEGGRRIRDQEVRPDRDVPSVLRKIIPGGALKYVEHGVWRQPGGTLEVDVKVPAMGDRFVLRASYTVIDLPGSRCRREFSGDCAIKVPLIGGVAERTVIENLQKSYEIASRVHREWIARRKAS
jgi:hypothetical protein